MIIYKLQNKINGKIYIGKTAKEVEQRIAEHLNAKSLIGNALRKYGLQSFDIFIMDLADDNETLNEKERYWIKFHDCKVPNGYNLTGGGEGIIGYRHSKESKLEMSKSRKGKILSEETKKRMSQALKGRKHSEETKEKIRQSNLGQKRSEEAKQKMSNAAEGRRHSEKTKKKMSDMRKGKTIKKGWKHTEEAKNKIRISSERRKHTEEVKKKIGEKSKQYWESMRIKK